MITFCVVVARDSRKIFRLFKSVNEFHVLSEKIGGDLIWQPKKVPVVMEILSKIGFFFYWIFDNLQILSNIKFINSDPSFHLKIASWGWVFGLVFAIAKQVYDLLGLLKRKSLESKVDGEGENFRKDPKLDFLILKTLVDITGKLGDFITATNGAGIAQKIMGRGFSEGVISMGGLWAAIVSLWNVYLK